MADLTLRGLTNATNLVGNLMAIKGAVQQGRLNEKEEARRQSLSELQIGTPGTPAILGPQGEIETPAVPRVVGSIERGQDLQAQQLNQSRLNQDILDQDLKPSQIGQLETVLAAKGLDKQFKPLLDYAKMTSLEPDISRGEAYIRTKQIWPTMAPTIAENIMAEHKKKTTPGPSFDATYAGSEEAESRMEMYDNLLSDKGDDFVDDFLFPQVADASALVQQEADTASNLAEAQLAKAKRTSTFATDIDDFVERANQESINRFGKPLTPGQKNTAALKFKRAQAEEEKANRLAVRTVDADTAQRIKFNEKTGTMLSEITNSASLLKAKGIVTPQGKIDKAKVRMTGNLATLANHYVDLDSTGAMLNVDNTTTDNVMAAMRSSTIGQQFGRITGTNEQSIRSSIKKLKPLLIQDIRQSTDMGARGLDSEKELEFYLQAATDEKTDIQSNIAAIVVLDEAFGQGNVAAQLRNLTDESIIKRISTEGNAILNPKQSPDGAIPEGAVLNFDAQGNLIK